MKKINCKLAVVVTARYKHRKQRIKKFCAATAVLGGKIYGVSEAVNRLKDPSLTYLKAKETGVVY